MPGGDPDAGIGLQCQIQQINRLAIGSGVGPFIPVIPGKRLVFFENQVADWFADCSERLFCWPTGKESLDQIYSQTDDGSEFLSCLDAFSLF